MADVPRIPNRHCFVVGIDVGTQWTRVCYGWSANVDYSEITTMRTWPTTGTETKTAEAVPTEMAYSQDQRGKISHLWGYLIPPGMPRYSCMKLLLDQTADDPDLRAAMATVRKQLPPGRSAWQIMVDFLRQIYAHILVVLNRDSPDRPYYRFRIKFWMAIPAEWSDQAQCRMWGAAKQAGFGSRTDDELMIVPESEAAVFGAVSDPDAQFYGAPVQLNENMLVCDCGGGTVDISAYRITNDDPWELSERSIGSRARYGTVNIDRRLHQLLFKRFGQAYVSLLRDRRSSSRMMRSFEWNKRRYRSRLKVKPLPAILRAPASPWYDPVKGEVILSAKEMEQLLLPVVVRIVGIISDQAARSKETGEPVDYVLLVGGWGASPYVRDQVRQACANLQIRIGSPADSAHVMARGAVVRGFGQATGMRERCPQHYGLMMSRPYRATTDSNRADLYPSPFLQQQMNTEIVPDSVIPIPFHCLLQSHERTVTIRLRSCSQEDAPKYYDPAVVQTVCDVVANLQDVDFSRLPRRTVKERIVYKVELMLEILLGQKHRALTFRVRLGNQLVGLASVQFQT
ncbi:Hsp70 family protein [Aspergillus ibericus CBS 121593]|uniref:Actin-like ATPase domain-containing protein n=1 Tax=Aspergillus ibericus CBS 121593 TaxID=1448316 RepID=A0A395GX11_9EURO|nr:actin-like ATPase domain-containing protein [Aspergillus ibericus CBS 121593]RAL00077.1 actin-like ATPase domain-containing protein [Aspergillus ibericus CBS 121593]